MLRSGGFLLALMLPCAALAQTPVSLHASYDVYAAGLQVAKLETGIDFGLWNYQMSQAWHTTGLAGLLFRGHQFDRVSGSWHGLDASPSAFLGRGMWRGKQRVAAIDYQRGQPVIRELQPPNNREREPVPQSLRANTIDTLSALAQLLHVVADTGRCDSSVDTYDGRRAVKIEAHTVGEEILKPSSRSNFAGPALRCDFSGRMIAGFKFGDDRAREAKPMHGSAWLAPVVAGGPPLPVRMAFETRWFGEAVMYLIGTGPGSDLRIARRN